MRIGDEILSNLNDYYRKIRNTFRFILGNIGSTNIKDCINYENLNELEKYILAKLCDLEALRLTCLKNHTYHTFYKTLFEFCSIDLSSFYFDIRKDALYCSSKDSHERKSVITVIYHLYDYLTTWFAPVLSHTMEECWREFKTERLKSVHLKLSKKIPENWKNNEII